MATKKAAWKLFSGCLAIGLAMLCAAQEQYPKPLNHTPTDHPAAHVLLLSIDGLHAVDLANWIATHPRSALAELSTRGVIYTNAHTPMADPAAGLVALATGGTPTSTGIIRSEGYDHELSPAGSNCRIMGTVVALDASYGADGVFDSAKAPLDPHHGCTPLRPHNLLRVNTVFEAVQEKTGRTAWAGASAATTDLLRGPSGKGLDDACGFQQPAHSGDDFAETALTGDEARASIVLRWIDGEDCAGNPGAPVPTLFGMSFVSLAAAQAEDGMGYSDAIGTPSTGLAKRFEFVDAAIGRMVLELKAKRLYDSTWIFVASPYGQTPMDQRQLRPVQITRLREAANTVQPDIVTHIVGGDAAMVWLSDPAATAAVVKAYSDRAAVLGIQDIYFGARLTLTLNSPETDSRMPDIVLQASPGVIWGPAGKNVLASYGGISDWDTHVALLVSGAQLTGRRDPTYVPTTQLAPLLLRALGMEKFDLQALHKEHSPALPGVF
ncbi:MAG TPA: alkaline phosphatase family protein [Terracidiphilus sp.]|nr:alkaline phosphatase family protein [Terracidiphilus sp.]